MTQLYNDKQRNFSFSMAAYLGTNLTGSEEDIEKELSLRLNKLLKEPAVEAVMGKWDVVWGPCVFQSRNSDVADNVMYVVKGTYIVPGTVPPKLKPEYVIAIAGTYPKSRFDVIIEDGLVGTQVPFQRFPIWPRSNVKISRGTSIGYRILKEMVYEPTPGKSQSLIEFLQGAIDVADTRIVTTGHSLGGALCPALALWLQRTKKEWDNNNPVTVSTYPYASPSPGNKGFSDAVSKEITGEVCRTWNKLDAPSYWWNKTTLEQLPTLYAPNIEPGALINAFSKFLIALTRGNEYIHVDNNAVPLPGKFNQEASDKGDIPFKQYFGQMKYQHVNEYFELLGTQLIGEEIAKIMGKESDPKEQDLVFEKLKALIKNNE